MDEKIKFKRPRRDKGIDRISQLPEHIIHIILSFLPTKEVVRARVYSKAWLGLCSSFPISDFCDSLFGLDTTSVARCLKKSRLEISKLSEIRDRREKFKNFVNSSLLRQLEHNASMQKFRLSMTVHQHHYIREFTSDIQEVDHWIEIAAENHVQELDIHISKREYHFCAREAFGTDDAFYCLPQTILSSKYLTILRLRELKTDNNFNIHLPSLRLLSLNRCIIDDKFIRNLSISCPMIEDFALIECPNLKSLQLISAFMKLKKVKVYGYYIQKIEIAVPSLQILHLSGRGRPMPSEIDIAACKNLQILKLKFFNIPHHVCRDIGSIFPLLKVFVLIAGELKRIKISCPWLEKLKVYSSFTKLALIIEAPLLHSFKHLTYVIPSLVTMDTPSLQKVEIDLRRRVKKLTAQHFLRMRKFLSKFNHIECLTLTILSKKVRFNLEDLKDIPIPPLPDVKCLKLDIYFQIDNRTYYEALVDGVFWSFQPKSVILSGDYESNNQVLEVVLSAKLGADASL